MFRGRYQHTIDPKGRLSVPAKFRDVLAEYGGSLIVVPNVESLEVHPIQEWERLENRINEKSAFDTEVRKLGRLYISRAKELELDAVGRILLPADSREQGHLGKDVTLVGLGRPFFEIWDRARLDEYDQMNGGDLKTVFEKLAQLGV